MKEVVKFISVVCGGVVVGQLYGSYKYYGTLNPYKQTMEQLRRRHFK